MNRHDEVSLQLRDYRSQFKISNDHDFVYVVRICVQAYSS